MLNFCSKAKQLIHPKITSVLMKGHKQSQCCDWKLILILFKQNMSSYMKDLDHNQT